MIEYPKNKLGLTRNDYKGGVSTLCAGCGHDSITNAIIQAVFELAIPPEKICKMSGIGCSSKTPGYFISRAHAFNSVHGRMPTVTTGANAANHDQVFLGVSGDGDSTAIGLSHFLHAMRRDIPMLYIVENNGCYGLTKGQFSATADIGSQSKKGLINEMPPIDPVMMALQLGAGFVARSFSGDKKQLIPLIKAGLSYPGFALIDVISPCVTFNNHDLSTKSYGNFRKRVDYVKPQDPIVGDTEIKTFAGDTLSLKTSNSFKDAISAMQGIMEAQKEDHVLTGLLYFQKKEKGQEKKTPLSHLDIEKIKPKDSELLRINSEHR